MKIDKSKTYQTTNGFPVEIFTILDTKNPIKPVRGQFYDGFDWFTTSWTIFGEFSTLHSSPLDLIEK